MFCPVCKAEFREGFTECKSCQVNLVEDLDNLEEKITGEFLLCTACQNEYHEQDIEFCEDCGLKLVRAVLQDDEYIFLEAPQQEYREDSLVPEMPDFEHLTSLDENESVVLIESEDVEMLVRIQHLLNVNNIDFDLRWPEASDNPLGTLLGSGSPMDRDFPRILVRPENEGEAIRLITADQDLGLGGLPPELEESDEDDEENDEYERNEY